MKLGRFIGEMLHNLRRLGTKLTHGVHVVDRKLGGWMLSAATPAAAFSRVLGDGIASACPIGSGIGGKAGGVEEALNTGAVNLGSMKGHVGAIRTAYGQIQRPGSNLERG
jgi:hypothetical protein